MDFIFDNNTPIYMQLVHQLKGYIISGELQAGEKLPSVRDLALQCRANPNTVQKALSELGDMGLIFTERTNGKFVTKDAARIEAFRQEYAAGIVSRFFGDMESIGLDAAQAIDFLQELKGENK